MNLEGYSEQRRSGVVRTPMEVGPDFVRRRTSAVPVNLTSMLVLTDTQRATLVAFHDTTLEEGSQPFTWTHPVTGAAISARFLSPPSYAARGDDQFEARIEIEVLPS